MSTQEKEKEQETKQQSTGCCGSDKTHAEQVVKVEKPEEKKKEEEKSKSGGCCGG